MNSKAGELFIVATPIGNMRDMSYRAVEVLNGVDLILAEDTRNAMKLLSHYQIRQPMKALHEHNEKQLAPTLVEELVHGKRMALISDAGTPLMSDPGFRLVRAAQHAGIQAITIPGACAAIAALSIAGLPTDRFVFEGFLPAKMAARERHMHSLIDETRTMVFYEARHRILAFLKSLAEVFGAERRLVVARELTKKFESVYQGIAADVLNQIKADELAQKGEFVVILAGAEKSLGDSELNKVLEPLVAELGVSMGSKLAAKITGANKNLCYQRALELTQGNGQVAQDK